MAIFTGEVLADSPAQNSNNQEVTTAQTTPYVVDAKDQYKSNLAYSIGIEAYLYGFPLVDMVKTMQGSLKKVPLNSFDHVRNLADENFRDWVKPNNDTLYSLAWLDLSKGPVELSIPKAEDGRYFTFQFIDAYTNSFHYIGTRTNDTNGGKYVIVGPGWKEKPAAGKKVVNAPTNMVWILGRTLVNGKNDVANVNAIQDQYKLTPYKKNQEKPNIDLPEVSEDVLNDPVKFFDIMTRAMKLFPGTKEDAGVVSQFKLVGIDPETGFQGMKDPVIMDGLTRAFKDAKEIMLKSKPDVSVLNNNWSVFNHVGSYGTDYLSRAVIAYYGIGAINPEEGIYTGATINSTGKPLRGDNQYIIHFDKDNMPPVNAFWSICLYGPDQFFVANPINRFSIGDRTEGLRYNPDGSLDLYVQNSAPIGHESNWLPAPKSNFILVLRMYLPKQIMIDGKYQLPLVQKVN
ncbi:DUF1254 domain-containing protein [Neobacillus pocheonensis]|uniref:DUF1254 domain-containing protein n=1 Tax=Neobacillus pocheonensis TaxID=363869 RepID=A0ABT0WE13_9BACI|nr:DUF1254 domain-containing protein [Neobacillus pocheonensis]